MKTSRCLILAFVVVLGSSVPSCATGPSFQDYVEKLRDSAGENAEQCGVVALGEPRGAAFSCGRAALDEGRPFWLIVQVMGIDSEIFLGLAVDQRGRAWAIDWDSDPSGGSAWITPRGLSKSTCDAPILTDLPGELPIQCSQN